VLQEAAPLVQASPFHFMSYFFCRTTLRFLPDLLVSVDLMCRCIPHLQESTLALRPTFLDLSHSGRRWFMRFVQFFSRRVFPSCYWIRSLHHSDRLVFAECAQAFSFFSRLRSFRSALLAPGVPGIATTGQDIRLLYQLTTR
jgi:hypothetical protein